jgi:hypothetical protein
VWDAGGVHSFIQAEAASRLGLIQALGRSGRFAWTPSFKIIGIAMQVHLFRGPGRVFGFTSDLSGANLPPQFAPWSHFKSVEMRHYVAMAGPLLGAHHSR